MRSLNRAAQRKLFGIGASITAGALIVAGSAGLAASADPSDDSEALGQFLGGTVAGVDLDTIVALQGALAENPSGADSVSNPLAATVFEALTLALGPIDLFGDNGIIQLGAVAQYAEAQDDGDAFAGSGAVTNTGAIAIDAAAGPPSNATVSLTPLVADNPLIETLDLSTGALAAIAGQVDGGTPTSDYLIADLALDLESDAVSAIYTQLQALVTTLETTLDGLDDTLNSGIEAGINVAGLATIDANVALTLPDLDTLLPGSITIDGVTVDLEQGTIGIDLEAVLLAAGFDLNNLPPNTDVLSGPILAAITTAVLDAITEIVETVETAIVDAIEAITLSGNVTITLLGGLAGISATVGGTLLVPDVTVLGTGLVALLDPLLALLGTTLTGVGDLIEALLGLGSGPVSTILSSLTSSVDGILGPVSTTVVTPLLALIDSILSLTVNVQPTAPPVNATGGDLGTGSFTVRALSVGLGPVGTGAFLATLDLASATVRGTDAVADADADVDTDTDTDTDVDADADIDADVDVDAPDTDVDTDTDVDADADADADGGVPGTGTGTSLPNTGSGLDSLWLIGFGSLLLLAGGATLLVRRRDV